MTRRRLLAGLLLAPLVVPLAGCGGFRLSDLAPCTKGGGYCPPSRTKRRPAPVDPEREKESSDAS